MDGFNPLPNLIQLDGRLHEIWSVHSQENYWKLLPPDVIFWGENAPNSISAGALPQTPLGSLQRSPRSPSWNLGGLLRREGDRKIGEGKGGKGRGRQKGEESDAMRRGYGPQTKFLPTPLYVTVNFWGKWFPAPLEKIARTPMGEPKHSDRVVRNIYLPYAREEKQKQK